MSQFSDYQQGRIKHWDSVAQQMEQSIGWAGPYHQRLMDIYRFLIPSGMRVLEIGCANGDLLASLQPSLGVGVDFSQEMVSLARRRHPELCILRQDAHEIAFGSPFDVIILSDLVNDLWDIQAVFERCRTLSAPQTRLILNTYSRLWEIPLAIAQRLGLAKPVLKQNWLTMEDVSNLLYITDFEVIRTWQEILLPLPVPVLASLSNRFLVKLIPFRTLALSNFLIARPYTYGMPTQGKAPVVSVIVPARSEAGNIHEIFERVPQMGGGTELIFVEGHSKDNTYETIEREMANHPRMECKLIRQPASGKGDAVRTGFSKARGEILMILDADLTVPPEDLLRFYQALYIGKGEFVNGVRLVYPMENQAMRFLNLIGNKFFTLAFSSLLGQPIKDTLCGTKVLWRKDYERIMMNRDYFGDFDPFGDFDLLFGAAKLNLKIVDLPVRYHARIYGKTNIQRWKHGWLLLKMMLYASKKIKFI